MVNKADLLQRYRQKFPGCTPAFLVRAPGRVNLIGEHTDYNDGFVLPIAMSQSLYVVAAPSQDAEIVVHSSAFNETITFPAGEPGARREPGQPGTAVWTNYVRGVAAMLANAGIELKPGRLLIHSDVPIGGGVSSSAALEVGSAMALLALAQQGMDPIRLALLARRAEHEYAASPCGIMDQFICVLGRPNHALLLDCRSQSFEQVPLPFDQAALVVMNTQVKHEIGSSEYPVRQQQCRQGLAVIQQTHPDVAALRDLTPEMLNAHAGKMEPVTFNRCRHVVTEIARTSQAADALRAADLDAFGRLMFDSHESLRDDYAVSCAELDHLVEVARSVPGVYGARMTGGGFGGCAITLVRRNAQELLRAAVARHYDTRFDKPAILYATTASPGASTTPL